MKVPLLYLYIADRVTKMKGSTTNGVCTKAMFRKCLTMPLGINRRMAEFLMRDLQRYGIIGQITPSKIGLLEFKLSKPTTTEQMTRMRKAGLL